MSQQIISRFPRSLTTHLVSPTIWGSCVPGTTVYLTPELYELRYYDTDHDDVLKRVYYNGDSSRKRTLVCAKRANACENRFKDITRICRVT